jgi:MSHA biogenesis protein MshP
MNTRHRSSGAALMTAIFLVAVLAALGIAMSRLSTVENDTRTKAVLTSRVYYGAKAGLEWAIQQVISNAVGGVCPAGPPSLGAGLTGVTLLLSNCVVTTHGVGNYSYYLAVTATTGTPGSPSYAERRMEATVTSIP